MGLEISLFLGSLRYHLPPQREATIAKCLTSILPDLKNVCHNFIGFHCPVA